MTRQNSGVLAIGGHENSALDCEFEAGQFLHFAARDRWRPGASPAGGLRNVAAGWAAQYKAETRRARARRITPIKRPGSEGTVEGAGEVAGGVKEHVSGHT